MILQGPEGGFMGSACVVEREKMKIVAWDQEDHNSRPPDTVNLNHLFIRPPPSSSSIPSSHGIRWRQDWGWVGHPGSTLSTARGFLMECLLGVSQKMGG